VGEYAVKYKPILDIPLYMKTTTIRTTDKEGSVKESTKIEQVYCDHEFERTKEDFVYECSKCKVKQKFLRWVD
jgi:hypothetical protein